MLLYAGTSCNDEYLPMYKTFSMTQIMSRRHKKFKRQYNLIQSPKVNNVIWFLMCPGAIRMAPGHVAPGQFTL